LVLKRGVTSGVGGDDGQPTGYSQLLAAVQRACGGEHLDPHVAVSAVDSGNHVAVPARSDIPISLCLWSSELVTQGSPQSG
jgi:hypothetical protein